MSKRLTFITYLCLPWEFYILCTDRLFSVQCSSENYGTSNPEHYPPTQLPLQSAPDEPLQSQTGRSLLGSSQITVCTSPQPSSWLYSGSVLSNAANPGTGTTSGTFQEFTKCLQAK